MQRENDMKKYIEYVFKHNAKMPECKQDIERISTLHSWYKHLAKAPVMAYPLLMIGEEPKYPFNPHFTCEDQSEFHWRIIMDYNVNGYTIKLGDDCEYEQIPGDVAVYMQKFPIKLTASFAESAEQHKICEQMCIAFWEGLFVYDTSSHAVKDITVIKDAKDINVCPNAPKKQNPTRIARHNVVKMNGEYKHQLNKCSLENDL